MEGYFCEDMRSVDGGVGEGNGYLAFLLLRSLPYCGSVNNVHSFGILSSFFILGQSKSRASVKPRRCLSEVRIYGFGITSY